ncbi:MAG: hypothetical protein VCE75_14500, partial [Alphaproteobacteria bacterium]
SILYAVAPKIAHQIGAAKQRIDAGGGEIRHAGVLEFDIRSFALLPMGVDPGAFDDPVGRLSGPHGHRHPDPRRQH